MTWDRDAVTALRAAVAQRDVDALRAVLDGRDLDPVLQHVGDGLLAVPDDPLTGNCAIRLRERGLEGDAELAEALEGRSRDDLRPLPVDLEELASIMEGDPLHGGGRLDLVTGEIWHGSPYEDEDEPLEDDRWLWVHADSRAGWNDMADFVAAVSDDALAGRLERALHGRRAFRRFRDELSAYPDELTRFQLFTDERRRGRARTWLAGHGLRPGS